MANSATITTTSQVYMKYPALLTRPVARIKQQAGPKTRRGAHFLNTVLDVCSNQGPKREMEGHRLEMGGRAPLPPCFSPPVF